MTSLNDLTVVQLADELADRQDEIKFLRRFIERTLVGSGFSTWVRFHIALQDYSPLVRDGDWQLMYLHVIAKAAAMETEGRLPPVNVLTSMAHPRRDYVALSRRRRRSEG